MSRALQKSIRSERGAALLSVLLIVAVMSIAALAMLNNSLGAISKARIVDARSQISWQITGAEEAGLIGVERLRSETDRVLHDRTPNFQQSRTTPLPTGVLTTRLEDDSNCFNVNALAVAEEESDEDGQVGAAAIYEDMLSALGLGPSEVEALRAGLVDWIDGDRSPSLGGAEDTYYSRLDPPYRPANVAIVSVTELRAVRGYSPDLVRRLGPLLCARDTIDIGVLNINTLTPQEAPLLAMAFSGELNVIDAIDLIEDRPIGGWPSVDALLDDDRIQSISIDLRRTEMLSIQSRFLRLVGEVALGDEIANFSTIYDLPDAQPARIVRRMYGGV